MSIIDVNKVNVTGAQQWSLLKMAMKFLWHVFRSTKNTISAKHSCASILTRFCTTSSAKISVTGASVGFSKVLMVDEPLDIVISGLKPEQNVTLRATSTSGGGNVTLFQSFAHYEADMNGCVKIKEQESKGGTYSGVESMGLFWSMIPLKNDGITVMNLSHRDVNVPVLSKLELYDGFIDFGVSLYSDVVALQKSLSPLDCKSIERWYLAKDRVASQSVREGRIRGEVFFPKNAGKCQGVIDLFGSAGGLMAFRAALLASHGFTTYALPYFSYDDLPIDANNIEIEYFEEAIEWFLKHPNVKSDGVATIATSFGVSPALLLATNTKNKIKASVCINGSDWIILHPISIGGRIFEPLQADYGQAELSSDGFMITRNIYFSEEEKNCQPAAQIPVEKMSGRLLYLASGDDHNINSAECARQLYERFKKCGKEDILETVVYPGAGHLLEPPYSNHCKHSFHQKYKLNLSFGGNPVSHARAQEDSWNRIINLLHNI